MESPMDPSDRYRAVGQAAERAGHGIIIVENIDGKDGVITSANKAVVDILGYSQDELVGKTIADIIHPDSLPAVVDGHRCRQKKEDMSGAYEIKLLRSDGSAATVEASGVGVETDGKAVMVVFVTDISGHTLTEEMLHESEAKYRHLVENAGASLYSVDENGITTYISPAFESLFGRNPAELIGKRFADFIHPEDLPTSMENFRRVMSGSLNEPWECRMVLPGDTKVFWVQGYNRPVYRGGAIVGFQGVLVDVTARKQVDALKDQFIALVSHELRTPLTVIMGALNTVLTEGTRLSKRETRTLLEDAACEADALSNILDNLLELSRSRADRLVLHVEPVDLQHVIQKTIGDIKPHAPLHQLRVDLPETLPPLHADPIRLKRILHNLVENAVKYAPGGEVQVSARQEAEHLIISVHDQGSGISPEDQRKLFQPFQRIRNSETSDIQGTGLGLVVSRRLVEAHGGRIWVESSPGEGTSFLFALPLLQKTEER